MPNPQLRVFRGLRIIFRGPELAHSQLLKTNEKMRNSWVWLVLWGESKRASANSRNQFGNTPLLSLITLIIKMNDGGSRMVPKVKRGVPFFSGASTSVEVVAAENPARHSSHGPPEHVYIIVHHMWAEFADFANWFPWNGCRKDLSSSPAFLDGACCANTREFIDVDVCHISCMFREALVDLCEVKRSTSSQASFSSPESILAFQVVIGPSHPSHSSHPRHPHRCWWPSPPRRPGTCDGLESHDCQCEIKHIISRRMLYASVLVSNVLCRVMMSLGVSVSSEMCGIQLVYCTWPQVKLRTHAGFLPCTCSTWLWLQNIWSLSLPCLPSLRPHIHIRIYILYKIV